MADAQGEMQIGEVRVGRNLWRTPEFVSLAVEIGGSLAVAHFTPAQARCLAASLMDAADAAETHGRPATSPGDC